MIDKKLIYHYCSVETLFSIIKYKKLWLSDANFMNDKYEITWINEVLNQVFEKLKKENINDIDTIEEFRSLYKSLQHKKRYIMCFSKEPDLLSQWRGYGDDAKGVSIGFNLENNSIFNDKATIIYFQGKQCSIKENNYFLYAEEVKYNDNEFLQKLISVCKNMDNDVKEHLANALKDMDILTKHPYFKEENEVRLIYTPEDYDNSNALNKEELCEKISPLQFRTSNSKIIPYYEIDIQNDLNIIKEIRFGPKCIIDKDTLQDFLNNNGMQEVDIIFSDAPYQ